MNPITQSLIESADAANAAFVAKLNPTVDPKTILGCRAPQMKAVAKEFSKQACRIDFVDSLPHQWYDENIIHAILINTLSADVEELISRVDHFLPYVDNWAVCDTLASSLKRFAKHGERVWQAVDGWLAGTLPYTVRFGAVVMLDYFLDDNFRPAQIERLAQIHSDEYYVNMAIAWYLSFALVKQWDSTIGWFEQRGFDCWVHNKAIQKGCESYRIADERKAYLKELKIK